ncbi:hypothetical protein LFU01_11950 [Lysinibacillus fusiformis]|nr:hypothetical protein LFU01_11950 [Lysinibacillus fusiformis]
MKVKSLKIYEYGNPKEVIRVENKTITPPTPQEILVRMLARPINPSDLIPIWGKYAHRITLQYLAMRALELLKLSDRLFRPSFLVSECYLYGERGLGRKW